MSDIKTKGIVINSRDYKENDALVKVFTPETGIITVQAKGVKKAGSRLKVYTQSFCFADFEFNKTGENFLLTGANSIDNFFEIVTDMDKYQAGFALLEVVSAAVNEGERCPDIFVFLLKSLKALCYENINSKIILIKFLTDILSASGFKLNLNKCSKCGSGFFNKIYLNIEEGEFVCVSCRALNDYVEVTPSVYNSIRIISNTDYDKLSTIKIAQEVLADAVALLIKNINNKFMCKIKSV